MRFIQTDDSVDGIETDLNFTTDEESLINSLEEEYQNLRQASENEEWYENEFVESAGRFSVTVSATNTNSDGNEENWDSSESTGTELRETFKITVEYNNVEDHHIIQEVDEIEEAVEYMFALGELYRQLQSGELTQFNGWEVVANDTSIELQGYDQRVELREQQEGFTIILEDLVSGYEVSAEAGWRWGRDEFDDESVRARQFLEYINSYSPLEQSVITVYEQATTSPFEDVEMMNEDAFRFPPSHSERFIHVAELMRGEAESEEDTEEAELYRKKADLIEDYFSDNPIESKLEERREYLGREYSDLDESHIDDTVSIDNISR